MKRIRAFEAFEAFKASEAFEAFDTHFNKELKMQYTDLFKTETAIREYGTPGISSKRNIDKTWHFYHVTGHSFNDDKIYNFESANYRHNLLSDLCLKNNVHLIMDVIKPTHSHELLVTDSFDSLSKVLKTTNSKVSHFIKMSRPKKYGIAGVKVFSERPAYQPVKNHVHLLYLVKYFFENCRELETCGKKVPFNCFDQIEKGFYPPDVEKLYLSIYKISFSSILSKCKVLTTSQFLSFCKETSREFTKEDEINLFKNKQTL